MRAGDVAPIYKIIGKGKLLNSNYESQNFNLMQSCSDVLRPTYISKLYMGFKIWVVSISLVFEHA